MRIARTIITMTAAVAMVFGSAGDTAPFLLNTVLSTVDSDSLSVSWDAAWIGGDANATIVIADNGTEVKYTTGVGEFTHALSGIGRHELTYTTYIGGVAQDEIYTATVFKDWRYEVVDSGAVITKTTRTIGEVTIPAEIDGYPVTSVANGTFANCGDLTSVTIPNSITNIGCSAFYGCSGLTNVVIETDSIDWIMPGLMQVKFDTRFDITSTLDDAKETANVSGTIAAYTKVTGTPWEFSDPLTGNVYAWNEAYSTMAYFGQMHLEGGRIYEFGTHFDDDVYVKVNNQVLVNVKDIDVSNNGVGEIATGSRIFTGEYRCGNSGWYDVEFRFGDINGNKGSWGELWSADFGVGYRDDGNTDTTQNGWNRLIDPGN